MAKNKNFSDANVHIRTAVLNHEVRDNAVDTPKATNRFLRPIEQSAHDNK